MKAKFFAPVEFAAECGLSIATVRRLLKKGRLPMAQPGGRHCRILIPAGAINSLCTTETTNNPSPNSQSSPDLTNSNSNQIPGPKPRWLQQRNRAG